MSSEPPGGRARQLDRLRADRPGLRVRQREAAARRGSRPSPRAISKQSVTLSNPPEPSAVVAIEPILAIAPATGRPPLGGSAMHEHNVRFTKRGRRNHGKAATTNPAGSTHESNSSNRRRRGRRHCRGGRRLWIGTQRRRRASGDGNAGPPGPARVRPADLRAAADRPCRRGRSRSSPRPCPDHHGRGQPAVRRSVTLRPESAGRINAITFQEGQRVAKGRRWSSSTRPFPTPSTRRPRPTHAGEGEVRPRGRSRQPQLHLGPGEGRGGEQLQGRAGDAAALPRPSSRRRRSRAVRRHHRPALGFGRRLREGRRRPRQPRVDRSAQGRFPRSGDVPAPGAARPALTITLDALPGNTVQRQGRGGEPCSSTPPGRSIVIRAQVGNPTTVLRPWHVRARAPHHQGAGGRRWCCPSRRWCRRAPSSTCSRSSTTRSRG